MTFSSNKWLRYYNNIYSSLSFSLRNNKRFLSVFSFQFVPDLVRKQALDILSFVTLYNQCNLYLSVKSLSLNIFISLYLYPLSQCLSKQLSLYPYPYLPFYLSSPLNLYPSISIPTYLPNYHSISLPTPSISLYLYIYPNISISTIKTDSTTTSLPGLS